jgi:transporter family protein
MGLARAAPLAGVLLRSMGVLIGVFAILIIRFSTLKEALSIKPLNALYIIIGGILASIIGQLCFYHALKFGEASKVVPLAATYPLVAFILGIIFFKEAVTVAKIAGILFVLLGIILLK